jgi:hypothetical protein
MEFKCLNISLKNALVPYYKSTVPTPENIINYGKKEEIFHTIFYGAHGCGKYHSVLMLLSQHFDVHIHQLLKKTLLELTVKEKNYYLYKTSWHFEINVDTFLPGYQGIIIDIINELSKSPNVFNNKYNVILLRNCETMERHIQQQLRKLMEICYPTCRFIFTTSNLSRIDSTIQSRCLKIRLPSLNHHRLINNDKDVILNLNYRTQILSIFFDKNIDFFKLRATIKQIFTKHLNFELFMTNLLHDLIPLVSSEKYLKIVQVLSHSYYYYNTGYRKDTHIEALFLSLWNVIQNNKISVNTWI